MLRCQHLAGLAHGVSVPCLICMCARWYEINGRLQLAALAQRREDGRRVEAHASAARAEALVESMVGEAR